MTDLQTGIVQNLRGDGTVNLQINGGTVYGIGFPQWYAPQIGDNVLVASIGAQRRIIDCMTPNRLATPGSVAILNSAPGGGWSQIATTYAQTGVTSNPLLAMVLSSPPTVTGGTVVVNATASQSYDSTNSWRTDTHRVYQGNYGYGQTYGLWFYPSMTSTLSGLTLTRLQMTVNRVNAGGSASPVQLHLYAHAYSSIPGGAPTLSVGPIDALGATPGWGSVVTFDLPVSLATAIQAGTYLGIGITSNSSSDYEFNYGPNEVATSGQLIFTHS